MVETNKIEAIDGTITGNWVNQDTYRDILNILFDNMNNIWYDENLKCYRIRKNDLEFTISPSDTQKLAEIMFKINNYICRELRRRKHVLKFTRVINE